MCYHHFLNALHARTTSNRAHHLCYTHEPVGSFFLFLNAGRGMNALMSNQLTQLIPVAAAMRRAAQQHYDAMQLQYVDVPQIVGITGACENVDTLFRIGNRGSMPLFFCQTGQLTLEQALQYVPGVYTIMQSGRDEEIEDARHLRQFVLTEEEFTWPMAEGSDSGKAPYDEEKMYEALLQHIEASVKAMVGGVVNECGAHIKETFGRDVEALRSSMEKPFHRISYDDAVMLVQKNGMPDVRWGDDLSSQHEAIVVDVLNKGEFARPVFIMKYPKDIKFFNMKVSETDPRIVLSADLVFPYAGEGTGSAVREHNGERLEQRLLGSTMFRLHTERGGTIEDFKWYLDMVKTGNVQPHAGYGIGNERVMQYILGQKDIRDCSVLSRLAVTTGDWEPARARHAFAV